MACLAQSNTAASLSFSCNRSAGSYELTTTLPDLGHCYVFYRKVRDDWSLRSYSLAVSRLSSVKT